MRPFNIDIIVVHLSTSLTANLYLSSVYLMKGELMQCKWLTGEVTLNNNNNTFYLV